MDSEINHAIIEAEFAIVNAKLDYLIDLQKLDMATPEELQEKADAIRDGLREDGINAYTQHDSGGN